MSNMSRVSNTANHAHRLRNASYAPTSTPDAQRGPGSAGCFKDTATTPIYTPSKTVLLTGVPVESLKYPYRQPSTTQYDWD